MFLSLASNVFGLPTAVNLVLHNCYNASALFTIVVLLLHDCEARDSQLWTSQNIKCKDKEKAMQKQGKDDVLIKKELENI